MSYETLLFNAENGVARITINRPDAANAMNLQMARELMEVAIRCDEDPGVRAVLLSGGDGPMFCAGGDLKAFHAAGDDLPALVKEMTTYLHAGISRFARMNPPLIAAVKGVAAGGGFSLVTACDIVLAGASATFTMAYTRAGLSPDGSSTYFLSRLVGLRRAQELALTNRTLSAAEALDWGLINRVVADDELMAEADALAERLAAGATAALGRAKRLLMTGTSESLETQMELEARAIADCARGAEAREGLSAFLAKRTPDFAGKS